MKIKPNQIELKQDRPHPVEFDPASLSWNIKTDGPVDNDNPAGTYLVLGADGSIIRRTIDASGFIIHELLVKAGQK